ncbi:MAG: hypothetical protein CMM74_14330 [Rhodospirillaceae bacterium]|jgi:hypothetical protein|nr:hypothetical protein [Rhodospirillaceae bacterium]
MPKKQGGDLFIVDNSISGWTGLRYLQDWTDYATSFDIATGFFEIGSLLELDGKWQQLKKIRILMGDEMTRRTRKALLEAIKSRTEETLDKSIEDDKEENPFLRHGMSRSNWPRWRRLHNGSLPTRTWKKMTDQVKEPST